MSEYIHKSHNVTVLMYHLVFPAKYRRAVFDAAVDEELKTICLEIEQMIKSLTAREIYLRCPHVKRLLWGGEFWSDGYFAGTVGKHGDEAMTGNYVKGQGGQYEKLHSDHQLVELLSKVDGAAKSRIGRMLNAYSPLFMGLDHVHKRRNGTFCRPVKSGVSAPDSSGDPVNFLYLDSIFEFYSCNHLRQVVKPA